MNNQIVQEIQEQLNRATNGIFATHESIESATQYIKELLTSTNPEHLESMIGCALGIYHNTLLSAVVQMVGNVHDEMTPWTPELGTWSDHPDHLDGDWMEEVGNAETRLGYLDWVNAKILEAASDA